MNDNGGDEIAALARHRAGHKRQQTGRNFEADLDFQHRLYEYQHIGKLWTHSPPFVKTKKGWVPKAGGGPVDRTGHVRAVQRAGGGASVPVLEHDEPWRGDPRGAVVPVAFDAKVLSADHATYQHDPKANHQLMQLKEASEAGVFAFLLIYAPKVERVFAINIAEHFTALVSRQGVTLFSQSALGYNDRLNSVKKPMNGVDWIPLLQWCQPR